MATYYAVSGGGNWSDGSTWSTTSAKDASRTGGSTAPTSADTCYLDDYSGNVTVSAASAAGVVNCSGNGTYAGTLTFNTSQVLSVTGNVILNSTMVTAGAGTLTIIGSNTLTSGGATFVPKLSFSTASSTTTLSGNWINTGTVTVSATRAINKTSTDTFTANGGWTGTAATTGTATIILGGTGGTWTGSISNNLTINCTDLTIGSVGFGTNTLTYTAGTVTVTPGTALSLLASCTFNTNGLTWQNIILAGTATVTLASNFQTVYFSVGGSGATITMAGAYDITVQNLHVFSNNTATVLKLVSGQYLNVTNSIFANSTKTGSTINVSCTIQSVTASSAAYLNYSGALADMKIFALTITDIDASSSSEVIYNFAGATLTRTTNITNVTSADIGGGTSTDIFGII